MYQNKRRIYGTKVEIADIDGKNILPERTDKNLTYTYVVGTKLSNDVIRKAGKMVSEITAE